MGFALKYKDTDMQGSFEAWGTGFHYNYDSKLNLLGIARLKRQRVLAQLRFDTRLSEASFSYVQSLDKANQIKALTYSGNRTTDLSKTLDRTKLPAILEIAAHLSRYAFDLQSGDFEHFCEKFQKEFGLREFEIRALPSGSNSGHLFTALLTTPHNNTTSTRASNLPTLMERLSHTIVRDLITMEFGEQFRDSAQRLLTASTRTRAIGLILDENFIPETQINAPHTSETRENSALPSSIRNS